MKKDEVFGIRRQKGRMIMILALSAILIFGLTGILSASSGEHGEGGKAKGWVNTDTYRVMNFSVLAIALFLVLRKPTSKALKGRIEGIREQLKDLEGKKAEAEQKLSEYNEKLASLKLESESIVAEYIRQGNEAKERILREAESSAEKLEEQARRNIDHEFKMAKSKLQEEVMEKALSKAEEILKSSISDEDQDRLVDEYIEKVVA